MKAVLEFDLEDTFDDNAFEVARKGKDCAYALWKFREDVLFKHLHEGSTTTIEQLVAQFNDTLDELSINLDKLVI